MQETEHSRTDALIAAVWRAVARALATKRGEPEIWHPEDRAAAIRSAEHVEEMLRLTGKLYSSRDESL